MVYAYIAAALVVGLLIGVITLAVYWIAGKVTHDINKKTRQLISAYDEILNKKSKELSEISRKRKEAEEEAPVVLKAPVVLTSSAKESPVNIVKAAEIITSSSYIDNGADELYRIIREGVVMTPMEALRIHAPYVFETGNSKREGSVAEELLKKLDYDTVCELSLLAPEEQLKLLADSLSGPEKDLLLAYAADRESFSAIGFRDSLRSRAYEEQKNPTLYIPARDADRRFPLGVNVVIDNDICEGFRLEADNKLYDYSVRGREIS